jgi:hypothetical protein
MDERFASVKNKKEKASAFFDYLKEEERSQGLVMSTRANSDEDDSVAGGTIISGIRQMHPVPVLLPPEQCPDLLEVFGCPADKQVGGRVTRANFLLAIARPEPRDKSGIDNARRKRMARDKKLKEKMAAREARRQQGLGRPASAGNPGSNAVRGGGAFQRSRQDAAAAAAKKKKAGGTRRGPFVVKVFFMGGRGLPPSELIVTASDTMHALRQKLEFQHGIPAEKLHLFVGQRRVNMDSGGGSKGKPVTVGSIGLRPESELQVAIE